MTSMRTDVPIHVTVRGVVPQAEVSYARRKVEHLVQRRPGLRDVAVVITAEPNPLHEWPAGIEIRALVGGKPVRAKVHATQVPEAVDLAVAHLHNTLDRTRERTRTLRRRGKHPGRIVRTLRSGSDRARRAVAGRRRGRTAAR
jgi:ribosome-associated translation inhibitor RaiA